MKKQLMIVGIIIILLTVGLSGCNEISGLTSISEIRQHKKQQQIWGEYYGSNSNRKKVLCVGSRP